MQAHGFIFRHNTTFHSNASHITKESTPCARLSVYEKHMDKTSFYDDSKIMSSMYMDIDEFSDNENDALMDSEPKNLMKVCNSII